MRSLAALILLAAGSLAAQQPADWRGWLNQGVQAFKNARYPDAVAAFQKSVDLNPTNPVPRLYLGSAYMQQYIPGADSPENATIGQHAQEEFQSVLDLDSGNRVALASLASLNLNAKKWDEARDWYRRLLNVDPNNAEAYYTLGFIDWSQWYPAYSEARRNLGMRPEQPGPIADPGARAALRARWSSVLDDGVWNLNRALEINPAYDDAMAYMNLFIRERADLQDTEHEYAADVRVADEWVQKALVAKKAKAEQRAAILPPLPAQWSHDPPPPPPPPPQRIRIGAEVQEAKLVNQQPPVYPPPAVQARISGVVKFNALIDKDGRVANLETISGHPMLVPAAIDAVRQWLYQPTLLNGQPVEVLTQVNVVFQVP